MMLIMGINQRRGSLKCSNQIKYIRDRLPPGRCQALSYTTHILMYFSLKNFENIFELHHFDIAFHKHYARTCDIVEPLEIHSPYIVSVHIGMHIYQEHKCEKQEIIYN